VRAPTAYQRCYDPLGPQRPRRLAFAQVRLSAQDDCRSGGRAPSPGGADLAANQSRVAG
jgi:hypothetical protein